MNRFLYAVPLCLVSTLALAGPDPALAPGAAAARPEDLYFSADNPELTQQESAALAIAGRWQNSSRNVVGSGENGLIEYRFGAAQPSIVCAVLQVCDVRLETGEKITAINLGDTARWTVEPAVAGSGENQVQHVIVKPLDVGLETSVVVTTDRRTYHLRLRSHRTLYMPQVAFLYTDGLAAKAKREKDQQRKAEKTAERAAAKAEAAAQKEREEAERQAAAQSPTAEAERTEANRGGVAKIRGSGSVPGPAESSYLDRLNFGYRISGEAPWKPVGAYDDGQKTYIQMPAPLTTTQAPELVVRAAAAKGTASAMDYRVQGDRYIVDGLFDRAVLIAGSGSQGKQVTIRRGP